MSNKEKDQFKKRFSVFQIEEAELERMFKQEELRIRSFEVNEAAFQAAMAKEAMMQMGYGAGGGASQTTPAPTSELAEATLIYWEDATTGTWKFFVHNYGTNTSSDVVDTGLDYTDYDINDIDREDVVEQAGFTWQAESTSTGDITVFCVSPNGTVIESFTYPTSGVVDSKRQFESLAVAWGWVEGGQTYFKIFNGSTVSTASLPTAVSSISFNLSAGEASKNRTVSLKVSGNTTYVLTPAGDLIDVTSQVGNNYTNSTSLQSDFICFINRNVSSVPQSVVIVNEDGTVRNTFDLTALTVNSINEAGVYGENQWSGMFQESPGDWVWVKYDYTSDTFSTETHTYTNYDQIGRYQDFREASDNFNNFIPNSVVALYSTETTATWGFDYDYVTFMWSIGNGGTFKEDLLVGTTQEVRWSQDSLLSPNPSFLISPVGGTGFIKVGRLTEEGTVQFTGTGQLSEECASVTHVSVGSTNMFAFYTIGGDTRIEFWDTAQVQTHTVAGTTSWTFNTNGSTLVAINNDDYNDSFWYTENFPTINAMPALTNIQVDNSQTWGSLTGVQESKLIFWENNTNSQGFSKLYILTNEDGLSSEITGNDTPAELDLDLEKGVFNWIYEDETSGNIIISQYSLSTGSILSTVDTGVTSLGGSNWSSYGIRSLVWAEDTPSVGSFTLWLQGPNGTTTRVIETSNWGDDYFSHNDAEWAD
jgi:hypothetical protein